MSIKQSIYILGISWLILSYANASAIDIKDLDKYSDHVIVENFGNQSPSQDINNIEKNTLMSIKTTYTTITTTGVSATWLQLNVITSSSSIISETNRDDVPTNTWYINQEKDELYKYISQYRKEKWLNILTVNKILENTAQKFAKHLSDKWILSHYDDNGKDAWYRIQLDGLKNSYRWEIAAASLTISWAIEAWFDSPAHLNIFNSTQYNSIWIGNYKWFWVINYYYDSSLSKKTSVKIAKTCISRNYKKVYNKKTKKNDFVKVSCKKYK